MDKVISLLNDKNGKDKSLKIIQYSCKLLMHFGNRDVNTAKLASSMSFFRAMMRLFNWIECGYNITTAQGESLVVEALDFCTAITDDISCMKKMGILKSSRLTSIADRQGAITWFLSILINAKNAYKKYEKSPTETNLISFWKLVGDGVFCGVDVFEFDLPLTQILAGFMSGILAYYKLWIKL